jgi:WD40 repeat protein
LVSKQYVISSEFDSEAKQVQVFSLKDQKPLAALDSIHLRENSIECVAISNDEALIAVGTTEGFLLWHLRQRSVEWHKMPSGVGALAFPSNDKVWASAVGPLLSLWSRETGRLVKTLKGDSGITCIAFSKDCKRIAAIQNEGTLLIWDGNTYERRARVPRLHGLGLNKILFVEHGTKIVSTGWERGVKIYDIGTGKVTTVDLGQWVSDVAYSERKNMVVVATHNGSIWFVDPRNGTTTGKLIRPHPISRIATSDCGATVVVGYGTDSEDLSFVANRGILEILEIEY